MKRVIGYGLFWAAGGMVLNMLLDSMFIQVLIAIFLVLLGYRLYCFK